MGNIKFGAQHFAVNGLIVVIGLPVMLTVLMVLLVMVLVIMVLDVMVLIVIVLEVMVLGVDESSGFSSASYFVYFSNHL